MPFYKLSVILPGVGYIIPLYGSIMAIHGATYLKGYPWASQTTAWIPHP